MATDKQVTLALMLLRRAGYRTDWMSAEFKRLGATMKQRSGRVEDWVRAMSVADASDLIGRLKAKVDGEEGA